MHCTEDLSDVIIPTTQCPPSKASRDEWEAEAASLPYLQGAFDPATRWLVSAAAAVSNGDHDALRQSVHKLVRHGATFATVAGKLSIHINTVAACFVRKGASTLEREQAIAAEAVVRSGMWDGTTATLAKATGMTERKLRENLLPALGVPTEAQKNLATGGGLKYSVNTYEDIRKLRYSGMSYADIGRHMGLPRNTVYRMCQRRNFLTAADHANNA